MTPLHCVLRVVPPHLWPVIPGNPPLRVWQSKNFLVQEYAATPPAHVRLTISRTKADRRGRWEEGIDWETMQRIKSEVGYGGFDAVEVYPRDKDIVNVANMRHLWVMSEPLEFAWRIGR